MAQSHSIAPFPDSINRDYFAAWLSGFTDGEGCFHLQLAKVNRAFAPQSTFQIALRSDDIEIVRLIYSFFQCGRIVGLIDHRANPNRNPAAVFRVTNTYDQIEHVIPHFDKFPLLAKKKRDFAIWKQGVLLMHKVMSRRKKYHYSKWSAEERQHFALISHSLRKQRKYNAPIIPVSSKPQVVENGMLFPDDT